VEQIGRPLELDTDGIWAILPSSFPTDFKFKLFDGGKVSIGYPCVMLNADVHERYTNHQYQTLHGNTASKRYTTHSECSIFFELDGPYKAMILPASPEEGKLLKKKYAVYNFDGSLAELKGFELKRKGELEVVKLFQGQVFSQFLAGKSLKECYAAVGGIGNHWLDILHDKGMFVDDEELLALISEKKTISKTVDDYEGKCVEYK
jgi:DNA polymerase epsilon subunit 1